MRSKKLPGAGFCRRRGPQGRWIAPIPRARGETDEVDCLPLEGKAKALYLYSSAVTNILPLRELPPIPATFPLPVPRKVSTSPSFTGASGFKHSV